MCQRFFVFFTSSLLKNHIVKVFNNMAINQLLLKGRPKSETFFPMTYNIRNANS